MSLGMMILLYPMMYQESVSGSDDFILMSGEDFILMDGTDFLLMSS